MTSTTLQTSERRRARRSSGALRKTCTGVLSSALLGILLLGCVAFVPAAAVGQGPSAGSTQQPKPAFPAGVETGPGNSTQPSELQVFAYSFQHRSATRAASILQRRLSPRGTIEVQPGSNSLVVRDIQSIVETAREMVEQLDSPPAPMRFELRVVSAGPKSVISPQPASGHELPDDLRELFEELLPYDAYRVLAAAGMSSHELERVEYSLGDRYSVQFQLGELIGGRRLPLDGFRIVERPASTDKSRRLGPKELFHGDLNLWVGKPFTFVLTLDEARKEALVVAITCHRDGGAQTGDRSAPRN